MSRQYTFIAAGIHIQHDKKQKVTCVTCDVLSLAIPLRSIASVLLGLASTVRCSVNFVLRRTSSVRSIANVILSLASPVRCNVRTP